MKNTQRLLILVFISIYVPVVAFAGAAYWFGRSSLIGFLGERVTGVNNLKAESVNDFYLGLQPLAKPLADVKDLRATLVRAVDRRVDAASRQAANAAIDAELSEHYANPHLEEVAIVRTDRTVAYAFSPETGLAIDEPAPELLAAFVDEGQNSNRFVGPFMDGKHTSVAVTQPLNDEQGFPVGVIIFHYNFQSIIDEIAASTGLSETGESYIAKNEDQRTIVYLSPLRADPEAGLHRRADINDPRVSNIRQAVEGKVGSGLVTDYRDVSAIAAWSPLAIPDWGIVTKLDSSEGLKSLATVRASVGLMLVTLAVIMLLGIALAIRRLVSRPLRSLEKTAELIEQERYGEAEIDRSLLYSQDEFGAIATSLHHIVEHHKDHSHEGKR